jgi:hypothetical protein
VGVVHETPVSQSSGGGGAGSTVGVVVHPVPFQDSANVVSPWTVTVEPTASQAAAEAHATPESWVEGPVHTVAHALPIVLSLACWSIVHALPFHRSMSGCLKRYVCRAGDCDPTATQLLGDVQDTPCNSASPATGGVGCADHVEPFHRSTSAACTTPLGIPARV